MPLLLPLLLPLSPPLPPFLATDVLPPFARREDYGAYFARLVDFAPAGPAMRRLFSYVDADLNAAEEVALLAAIWRCATHLSAVERVALATCLDGRYAELLQDTEHPWWALDTITHLAAQRLPQRVQLTDARAGAFVTELLRHHGIEALRTPHEYPPLLVLQAAQAELAQRVTRLDEAGLQRLQSAALQAAEREPALVAQALAVLFELALHARDASTADGALAQLIAAGQAERVPAARVRAWLDGSAWGDDPALALPLQLEPTLQAQWLRPADWGDAKTLSALAATLQRPGPQARLVGLAQHLGLNLAAPVQAPSPPVLRALSVLSALDACYALVEAGGDILPLSQPLLTSTSLAAPTQALLHEHRARHYAGHGQMELAASECAHARRLARRPSARALLQQVLSALSEMNVPEFSPDWSLEEPFWRGLLTHPLSALRHIATYHLARLWTHGSLEPGAPRKCQHLQDAGSLWHTVVDHPAYAAEARRALASLPLAFMRRTQSQEGGRDHLWIPAPEAGCERLTLIFSCLASHHTHPEVQSFVEGMQGQHLLFIRNPEFNWYSDAAFDSVCQLIRERVLPRFKPEHVSCHYGSMGGHAALKVALTFGFRAVVFNPQTDLDLWAAFRAGERRQLWDAEQHASLHQWPASAFETMPLYYACGSHTADREALGAVIQRLRRCSHATALIEKYPDPHHPGLMARISAGPIPATLLAIGRRLDTLVGLPAEGALEVPAAEVSSFWDQLDAAANTKLEIQVRQGRLWWQPSVHTATRPMRLLQKD